MSPKSEKTKQKEAADIQHEIELRTVIQKKQRIYQWLTETWQKIAALFERERALNEKNKKLLDIINQSFEKIAQSILPENESGLSISTWLKEQVSQFTQLTDNLLQDIDTNKNIPNTVKNSFKTVLNDPNLIINISTPGKIVLDVTQSLCKKNNIQGYASGNLVEVILLDNAKAQPRPTAHAGITAAEQRYEKRKKHQISKASTPASQMTAKPESPTEEEKARAKLMSEAAAQLAEQANELRKKLLEKYEEQAGNPTRAIGAITDVDRALGNEKPRDLIQQIGNQAKKINDKLLNIANKDSVDSPSPSRRL